MSSVICNLCGADDFDVRFAAGVAQSAQIVECRRCGLIYANPRAMAPDHEQVANYDPDFVEHAESLTERFTKEALQVRDYADTRSFLAQRHPQRGKLLEVGSGYGYLLKYFREDGWEVIGVEPNEGLNRHARKALSLNVLPVILPQAKFDDASFDAVAMMHVIEHVPDPMDTLTEIFRILKPGGTFVMETPRYDTLMFKLLGRRERSLSCEGHIYFFTTKTLNAIARKAGFKVEREDMVGRSLTIERLVYNLGVMTRSRGLANALRAGSRKLGIANAAITFNVRDMERIYLSKPV